MEIVENKLLLKKVMADSLSVITSYLMRSRSVFLIAASGDGTVFLTSPAVSDILKKPSVQLQGGKIAHYLTEADADLLERVKKGEHVIGDEGVLLNFVDIHNVPRTIESNMFLKDDCIIIIGETPRADEEKLSGQLMQLNNELAVLSRENTRKSKALEKALNDLKQAEAMLVHQEKMASLGKMTAGIAHEINNPVAFVANNEEILKRDFDDLLGFINYMGDLLREIAGLSPDLYARLIGKAKEFEIAYLSEAIPKKIDSNLKGLERIKNIILDLRSFSRLDEAKIKLCDVSDNIKSTLRFLEPLMKERGVKVRTVFEADKRILCMPGALNQAVSNVVENAIQASEEGQEVTVTVREEGGGCLIIVEDSGAGIPKENLSKVFDPFFTTKPVGSGTGLGLSITYQIISAHKGTIKIESEEGKGTRVFIGIPELKETEFGK